MDFHRVGIDPSPWQKSPWAGWVIDKSFSQNSAMKILASFDVYIYMYILYFEKSYGHL